MKKCTKCKLEKNYSEYNKCSANKDGYYGYCKECRYGYISHKPIIKGLKICTKCLIPKELTYFSNIILKSKKYKQSSCKVCKNKARHAKRMSDPKKEYTRKRIEKLRDSYGITIADYNNMYIQQEGKCLICNKLHEKLDIDHCHSSGIVRGLLCGICNRALGLFKDSSSNLHKAILYLKETNSDKSQ